MPAQPPTPQWQPFARLSVLPSHRDGLLPAVTEHHKTLPPACKIAEQRRAALLALLSAGALLVMLVGAGWDTARAASQSGEPLLSIVRIQGYTLTLQFDNWTLHERITLSYSAENQCLTLLPLPHATFTAEAPSFQATYVWPSSGIQPGIYYLCATASEGTFPSLQTLTVTSSGSIQLTPGGPGTTPTSSPEASSSATPGVTGTPGVSNTPGNQGASGSSPGQDNTLVALILLCLLVLALVVYLLRLWLLGRQAGGQPP